MDCVPCILGFPWLSEAIFFDFFFKGSMMLEGRVDIHVLMRKRGVKSLAEPGVPKVSMLNLTIIIHRASLSIKPLVISS